MTAHDTDTTTHAGDLHEMMPLLVPLAFYSMHQLTLPRDALRQLRTAAHAVMDARTPDIVIPTADSGRVYLQRWQLIRSEHVSIYLHRFLASDDDRALHTHPADSLSVILTGSYLEETPADASDPAGARVRIRRFAGDVVSRQADAPHRIALETDDNGAAVPAESLFIFGPRTQEWGFWCPDGWREKDDFFARGCA